MGLPIPIRNSDRYFLCGQPGFGKTWLACAVFEAMPSARKVVVACKPGDDTLGRYPKTTLAALPRARGIARISPEMGDLKDLDAAAARKRSRESLENIAAVVWRMRPDVCTLWDDIGVDVDQGWWPLGMEAIYKHGRSACMPAIATTTNPIGIPRRVIDLAEHKFLFRVQHPEYRAYLESTVGVPLPRLGQLAPRQCYYHSLSYANGTKVKILDVG